jgi:UDP-2-acetamido-3-amino-2,3-dideoxy-glucuronate N-acetyltransferase
VSTETLRVDTPDHVTDGNCNVAVVGCGHWGKNLVRNFSQLGVLRRICDNNPTSLADVGSLYPKVQLTQSFAEVLSDPSVNAVVLATPASMHYEHVKLALEAGKHVLVEKPLALRYSEGLKLVELAKTQEAVLMVGHILEYHPAVALLKQIVQRGELGRILYLYSNRLNLGKVRQEENILWSFAPHDISVICSLIGCEPIEVSASGGSYLQKGIADVTVTNLLFPDGIRAHIFVSWLHPYKEQRLVVVGDRRMAVFDDTAREGKLKIYDKGIEWQSGLPVPRQTSETTLFFEELEPLRLECEHFLKRVIDRQQPLTSGESALTVLKILEGCQISLERGGSVIRFDGVHEGD